MSDNSHPLQGQLTESAVMLAVWSVDRALEFYRDKLGFTVLDQQPHLARMVLGSLRLNLVVESMPTPDKPSVTIGPPNTPQRTSVVLIFSVRDCQVTYETLKARGVQFMTPPQPTQWGGLRCFTRDPDGYLIQFSSG